MRKQNVQKSVTAQSTHSLSLSTDLWVEDDYHPPELYMDKYGGLNLSRSLSRLSEVSGNTLCCYATFSFEVIQKRNTHVSSKQHVVQLHR